MVAAQPNRDYMARVSRWLAAIGAVVMLLHAASAAALVIRGDQHWRGNDDCAAGWTDPHTDDSTWTPVTAPWVYMWPREWADADARTFWATSEGNTSCVRRHFALATAPTSATVHIWVDDDYELYINGAFVGASNDHWGELPGETYDVAALLTAGDNVIALKLIDFGGGERGALFSLSIPDAPDVAPSVADLLHRAVPWVQFSGIIAIVVLIVMAVRRLGQRAAPWVSRQPGAMVTGAIVLLVVACQWLLQTGQLYVATASQPWAEWNWGQVGFVVGLLALLVVACAGDRQVEEPPVRHEWLVLLAILLLALLMRTAGLSFIPPGFFQDEAVNGNDALSLFDGRPFEMWSDSIGGRPTMYLYLLGLCVRALGPTYMALKIVPVTFGVASVAALYLLGRIAFGPRPALWAAFFLAVSRWYVHFTRMAWEAGCVPFFSALGFALLLRGLGRCKRPTLNLVAGGMILSLGLYTYAAYRAVPAAAVLFVLATVVRDREVLRERWLGLVAAALGAAVVAAPLAIFAWRNPTLYWARYTDVSLTKYMSYYGTLFPWGHQIAKGLLAFNHLGDAHNLTASSHIDVVTGTLLLLGITAQLPRERRRSGRLVWVWLLTFVALASLTRDSPHATRLLGALPPALLLAGLGASRLFARLRSALRARALVPACVAAVLVSVTAINVYQYFIVMQMVPNGDIGMNVRARTLCELVAATDNVHFYWTEDVAYWCQPQCGYLVPGRYRVLNVVGLPEVLDTTVLKNAPRPVIFALGQEFIDRNWQKLPLDANGVPVLDLPARPVVELDREARPMYYLYRY